jgi:hypothetical protein
VLDSAGLSVHPSPDSPLLFAFKSQRRFAGIGVKMTTDKQPASKPPIDSGLTETTLHPLPQRRASAPNL